MEPNFTKNVEGSERHSMQRFRGEIPRDITQKILAIQPLLLQPVPLHTATLFEQVITDTLQSGELITGTELAKRFKANGGFADASQRLDDITQIAQGIDLNPAILQYKAKQIMFQQLADIGVPIDFIDDIFDAPITIKNTFHPNYCIDGSEIEISTLNIVRRAIDYQTVFGTDHDLQELAQIIAQRIIAHEVGHVVDGRLRYPSLDTSMYDLRSNSLTARSERFAEYWGRAQFEDGSQEAEIVENEALLQVAGVYHVWNAIDQYDQAVPQNEFSILEYFEQLHLLNEGHQLVQDHLNTRQRKSDGLYQRCEPEFYASPYPLDVVEYAVQTKVRRLQSSKS